MPKRHERVASTGSRPASKPIAVCRCQWSAAKRALSAWHAYTDGCKRKRESALVSSQASPSRKTTLVLAFASLQRNAVIARRVRTYALALISRIAHSRMVKALGAWVMLVRIREERECAAAALAERWKSVLSQRLAALVCAFIAGLRSALKLSRAMAGVRKRRRMRCIKCCVQMWREYAAWRAQEERRSGSTCACSLWTLTVPCEGVSLCVRVIV
jgi:hypothetical protein